MPGSHDLVLPPVDAVYVLRKGRDPLVWVIALVCAPFVIGPAAALLYAVLAGGPGVLGWSLATLFMAAVCGGVLGYLVHDDRRDRRNVAGDVLVAIGRDGVYLGRRPAQHIAWPQIAEVVVFHLPVLTDRGPAPFLVVVERGTRGSRVRAGRRPADPRQWGPSTDLYDREPDLEQLTAAVRRYGRHVRVWDRGLVPGVHS
jgi:hypothetical protein